MAGTQHQDGKGADREHPVTGTAWLGRVREGASGGSLRCSRVPSESEALIRPVIRGVEPPCLGKARCPSRRTLVEATGWGEAQRSYLGRSLGLRRGRPRAVVVEERKTR
jgi:hypothetical protein